MRFDIITLFPEMFDCLNVSIPGRAQKTGLVDWFFWNPRHYVADGRVDDRPYGGGPGMVMQVQPLRDAVHAAKAACPLPSKVIYLSPQGPPLTAQKIVQLSQMPRLILVAGHYEGVDERFIDLEVDEECSIGDYVLSGGELAVMVVMDAMIRLLPGALGDEMSAQQDSFAAGLLDCPHYTRPQEIVGLEVPEILLSGHHGEISRWRRQQALGRTWQKRPDLLEKMALSEEDKILLEEYRKACKFS